MERHSIRCKLQGSFFDKSILFIIKFLQPIYFFFNTFAFILILFDPIHDLLSIFLKYDLSLKIRKDYKNLFIGIIGFPLSYLIFYIFTILISSDPFPNIDYFCVFSFSIGILSFFISYVIFYKKNYIKFLERL